jgi:D-alanine-D-alanine ligase
MKQKPPLSKIIQHGGNGTHIGVLYGGMSRERDISLASAKSIIPCLLELGYKVTAIDVGVDLANCLLQIGPDVVFNCLLGTYGEDGCIPGILNSLNIPYTHCGAKSSAICFHKDVTRRLCIESGILVPKGELVSKAKAATSIKIPYVIKPTAQGSSISVEVILQGDERSVEDYDFTCGDTALVEEYIQGKELQVALLHGKALGLLEVRFPKSRIYDYKAKYTPGFSEHIANPDISQSKCKEILATAEKVYQSLCCRSIARAEFIYVPETEKLYFLEINTHPGFTPTSTYAEIAANAGIAFSELLQRILEGACCD